MVDDPPYLTVGTEVSAKYKGAFCEAKIRKVARVVKCRVAFKSGFGSYLLSDDLVKGVLRIGATVEAKHPDKNQFLEATISKIQDCSQYTVVFDDGDITTLRRSALCLKSGRHFNESETLDQLPLTHPEHFSNPVVGGRRGVRRRIANNEKDKDDSSEDEDTPSQKGKKKSDHEVDLGKVVCVEVSEKKKGRDGWFPALVVSPSSQDTVKIRVKEEYLVRSFKDGRYYTVPKKEITEFIKEQHGKQESNSTVLKTAVEKALSYLDKDELPPHWDRDVLFGASVGVEDYDGESDSEASEDVQREKKDTFVAQLYKFMEERGTPINKAPVVCNKDLDLHKLYNIVVDNGGYSKVTNGGQWKNITGRLGFGTMPSTSTINLVKQAYKKYLVGFEELNRKLGCTILPSSSSTNKPRNSRSVYRGGSANVAIAAKEAKAQLEEEKKESDEKEKKPGLSSAIIEHEIDSASMDSDSTKKSDTSADEPRRSRSRQESKTKKEVMSISVDEEKTIEKEKSPKKKGKPPKEKEKDTVSVKEETLSIRAEPPSPAPSSQGSKKGRGVSRKRKEKEDDQPPIIEKKVEEPVFVGGGISKEIKIQAGDKLSVLYPKGDRNVTYDAKVVDINTKNGTFFVHYLGWNTRYDEWIFRERIAENLSLRENYQSKAQGKGPATQTQQGPSSEEISDTGSKSSSTTKEPVKKRGRSVTPSVPPTPPTSSTGTRSKTGSIKRKRMSSWDQINEPLDVIAMAESKKRRVGKKSEKESLSGDESDDSTIEVKSKQSLRGITPPVNTTPTRSSKNKEKRLEKDVKEKDKNSSPGTSQKDKGQEVISEKRLNFITRAELKQGLEKLAKSKSSSSIPTVTSQQPKSMSVSPASSTQKLDIYDFEEETGEAPKLKMFSPRSPDKKDDKSGDSSNSNTPSGLPQAVAVDSKPKEDITPQPIISTPITESSFVSKPSGGRISQTCVSTPLPVTSATTAVVLPKHSAMISTHPPALPSTQPHYKGQQQGPMLAATTPGSVTRPSQSQPVLDVRGRLPPQQQQPIVSPRTWGPTVPPPLVPVVVNPVKSITTTTTTSLPIEIPVLTPRPTIPLASPMPILMRPLIPIPIVSTATTPVKLTTPTLGLVNLSPATTSTIATISKDAKPLPFTARKQELFPHLIQQQKGSPVSEQSPLPNMSGLDSGPNSSNVLNKGLSQTSFTNKPTQSTTTLQSPVVVIHKHNPNVGISMPHSIDISITPKKEKKKRSSKKSETEKNKAISFKDKQSPQKSPSRKRAKGDILSSPKAKLSKAQHMLAPVPVPLPQLQPLQSNITVPSFPLIDKSKSIIDIKKEKESKLNTSSNSAIAITKINEKISTFMQETSDTIPSAALSSSSSTPNIAKLSAQEIPKITSMYSITDVMSISTSKGKISSATGSTVTPTTNKPSTKRASPSKNFLKDSSAAGGIERGPNVKGLGMEKYKGVATNKSSTPKEKSMSTKASPFAGIGTMESVKHPVSIKPHHKDTVTTSFTPKPAASVVPLPKAVISPESIAKPALLLSPPHQMQSTTTTPIDRKAAATVASAEVLASMSIVSPLINKSVNTTPLFNKDYIIKDPHSKGSHVEDSLSQKSYMRIDDSPRPLTPSFLKSQEVLEPEPEQEDEDSFSPTNTKNLFSKEKLDEIKDKEDESCSSLLCEEELPGSPAPDDDTKLKFDFRGRQDKDKDMSLTPDRMTMLEETMNIPCEAKSMANFKREAIEEDLKRSGKINLTRQFSSGLHDTTPPSTPDSTSLSTETGSPHVDGGRISPTGEGGSSKSKDSSDGDSGDGDNSKSYYSENSPARKSSKNFEAPSSPASNKRYLQRGRHSSPPSKRRRTIRKKSPDDLSRSFGYRGVRTSSGRRVQSALDIHETLKIPPPPPPVNLGKPPPSTKFGHLYADLEGVDDSEDRINLALKSLTDIREKYLEIKARMQARERKEKRRKRRAREKAAAERQARIDAANAKQIPTTSL